MGFDKRETAERYTRREGDTLETIAQRATEADNKLSWQELARFNFGTDDADTVNECMRDELGCHKRDPANNFQVATDDVGRGELLIPRRFARPGLPTDKLHTLHVRKKLCPPQFLECFTVPGITFEFDKSFVRPSVVHHLKAVEAAAARHPEAKIMIFGHTDKVGGDQYNKGLSERRAKNVYAFIINDTDTWEALYRQENWGLRVLQIILADLGHDPGTIDGGMGPDTRAAMRSFLGLPEGSPVTNNAAFRKQLFAAYMSGERDIKLTPDRFMDPKHMGCGEYNPVEDTEERSEPNRRVMFYLFHKDRLPQLPCQYVTLAPCRKQMTPSSPRYRETFGCSFYDSIAHRCPCERAMPPEVVEFFGRPADHDDRTEKPHNLVVPEGSSVTLHWTVVLAHKVEIKGTAIDNSTFDVALPNDGATDNPESESTGQVTVTPSLDTWYALTAYNRDGQTVHHQTVMITLFPSQRPADQLSVRAAGDAMALADDSPGAGKPDVVMYAGEGDAGGAPAVALTLGQGIPPVHKPVPRVPGLMDFFVQQDSAWRMKDLVFTTDQGGMAVPNYTLFRAIAAAFVKTFNGFGVGVIQTDDRPPVGRNKAYADILFTFHGDEKNNVWYSMDAARDKSGSGNPHSSCGLVVRALWLLLGARHKLLIPYPTGSAINNARAFAILCGAYRGESCFCLPVSKKYLKQPEEVEQVKANGYDYGKKGPNDKALEWDEFNPQPGDTLFLDAPGKQHVLTVCEIEQPKSDAGIVLVACDGGQTNVAYPTHQYKGDKTDGTCNAICLTRRKIVNENGVVRPRPDAFGRVVSGWVDLPKLEFTAPFVVPWRNKDNLNLPEPEPRGP